MSVAQIIPVKSMDVEFRMLVNFSFSTERIRSGTLSFEQPSMNVRIGRPVIVVSCIFWDQCDWFAVKPQMVKSLKHFG